MIVLHHTTPSSSLNHISIILYIFREITKLIVLVANDIVLPHILFNLYFLPSAIMTDTTCHHKCRILPWWQMAIFIRTEHDRTPLLPPLSLYRCSVLINPTFHKSLTSRLTIVSDSFSSLAMAGTAS